MNASILPAVRFSLLSLALLSAGLDSRSATVSWDGGGGNNSWHTAANWSTDTVPGAADDVVVNVPGDLALSYTSGFTTVRSLQCEEGFQFSGGTLTVTAGTSFVHGPLVLTGGELVVSGASASFTASGSATNTGTHLTARNGGQLSLPTLTHLVRTATGDLILTADGANASVVLPNVTVGGAADFYQLAMNALNSGRVLMPSLSQMNGAIEVVSRGAGSMVDLSGLQGTLRNTTPGLASLEARDGASIQIPNVTALDRVDLGLYGQTLVPTAQLKAFTGAELYLQRTTNNFPGLTNAFASHITLALAARASIAGITRLGRTNSGPVALTVSDAGTVLELPNVTSATVEPFYRLQLSARTGARIALPQLTVLDGGIEAYADGAGALIDLPGLQGHFRHPKAGNASIEARNGGSILLTNVTSLDRISVTLRNQGSISLAQIRSFTDATFYLERQTNSFPAITNATGASFTAAVGSRLTLPGVIRAGRTNAGDAYLTAADTGVLDLPNLLVAHSEPFYQVEMEAYGGGRILVPQLSVMDGAMIARARAAGSLIDLSGMSGRLANSSPGAAELEVRSGASILLPNVTELDRVELTIEGNGQIHTSQFTTFTHAELTLDGATGNFPALVDVTGSSLFADNGANLTLPGVTQLIRTNAGNITITAEEPGSVVNLPNVTSLQVRPFYQLELIAVRGGRVLLPALSVTQGALDVLANGTNSVVDLSGLQGPLALTQAGQAALEVRSGGTILIPNVTALDQYALTIRDTGAINTEQLTAMTRSTVTLDNTIGVFPALTDTTGTTFSYLNGGSGVFQPPADLVISAISAPPAVVAGQPFAIAWQITNRGTSITNGSWSDGFYLSAGAVRGDDYFLGVLPTAGNLPSGAARWQTNNVVLPAHRAGTWHLTLVANHLRTVFEGTNVFNNTNTSVTATEVQAPDLMVEALTLTTNAALLGQSIGVTWRVRNAGTAATSGSWFERLTLVPPGNPSGSVILLEKSFAQPLAAGASATYHETVPLPLLARLPAGDYALAAYTDAGNSIAESVETNNTAGATIAIILPPLPDLAIVRVTPPATGAPGQVIPLTWVVTNQGNATANGPWTEDVFLAPTNTGAPAQLVASFSLTNPLPVAGFLSRTQHVLLPANLRAGLTQIRVGVDGEQVVAEQNEANNVTTASNLLAVSAALNLQVTVTSIVENASSNAIAALVSRNSDPTAALTVNLSSSDPAELTAPATVQIPAGKASAGVTFTLQRDGVFDADASVTLTATASGHAAASALVTVVNTDAPRLHLSIATNSLAEGAMTSAVVSHDAGPTEPLTVSLSSPNSGRLLLPDVVVIAAGQTSAVFAVTAADDTRVEPARIAVIEAAAMGFVGSSTALAIEENDLPQLTLSLANTLVREGAGTAATTATISRGNPSPRPLAIELENNHPSLVAVPATISIPAGQVIVSFPIAAMDDGLINGSRTAELRAFALASDSSQRVAASAPVALTVTDDDSPALSLVSARDIVAEGVTAATTLTVARNEASAQPLVVNLVSSAPGEATVPATATIPGGQTSVAVPLTSVNDQVVDGSKAVQITGSAAGFASAVATVVVTDSNQPDLIIAEINGPVAAETEAFINVSYRIANQGLTSAGTNWLTRVFLSDDPVVGNDTPLAEYPFNGTLPVGQSFGQSRQVRAPQAPGDYWLIVMTDTEGQIEEWSEQNNTRISARPIHITAAYQAVVQADLGTAPAGTVVPLHGFATNSAAGGPAPFVLVNIHVHVRGTKRVFSALTDADGRFALNFTPLRGEAGLYEIGAAHPGQADAPVQDSFTLLGLRAAPVAPLRLIEQSSVSGQVAIENLGDLSLLGLTVTVVSNAPNLTVTATVAPSLPGLAKAPLAYAITAGPANGSSARIMIRVTSTQGAQTDIPIDVTIESRQPRLVTYPNELVAGMKVGGQAFVQFEVVNAGGATSGPVHLSLPPVSWMHVATPNPLPPLAPGETNRVTLQLTPAANQALGAYEGTIGVNAGTAGVSVPFNFRALSEAKGDLRVTAVDEYTYFADGAPKVAGATVTVRDAVTDEPVATGVTDAVGAFALQQIQEGYYTIEVTADRHSRYRRTHLVVAGQANDVVAFLRRETVRYTWVVVPTEIGDRTRVTIITEFEAFVPIPVVTVDPPLIDLAEYTADVTQIDLKVMNHGLIAAKNAKLSFGTHPDWSFELLIGELGDIPARSSMTVPLLIRRTGGGTGGSAGFARGVFSPASGGGCTVSGSCQYEYECGGNALAAGFPVPVVNARASGGCGANAGGPVLGGSGQGGGGNGSGGGGPVGGGQAPSSCNSCLLNLAKAAINCALKFVLSDALKCAKDSYGCASGLQGGGLTGGTAYTCGKAIINCLKAAGRSIPLTSLLKYPECAYGLLNACNGPNGPNGPIGGGGGAPGGFSPASEAFAAASSPTAWPPIELVAGNPMPPELRPLALRLDRYQHFIRPMRYAFNNPAWLEDGDTNRFTAWLDAFLVRIELNTADAGKVSASERGELVALPLPPSVTVAHAHAFIDRWNRSIDYWNAGIFTTDQVPAGQSTDFLAWDILGPLSRAGLEAFEQSEAEGYQDPIDAIEGYKLELQRFLTEGDNNGVCARVRLQLDQEAVVTRDAFSARLEIANDTFEDLSNISIEVNVRRRDGSDATDLFAIRPPVVSGLTAVDGTGLIAPNSVGQATWTIIPTTDAARNGPEDFVVGGVLRYHHDGLNLTVPLAGYSIAVHPSPSLAVKYFHQRDVFADDPFTTEIEPSVPFSLAVMVENKGHGIARNVRIDSAQPRIIENGKGLLADFKIIATEVAGQNLEPSLTVNFGRIDPGTNAIGRWLLTSTILGGFVDYSATFEHLDALGDKKLALIGGVEIHELIHVVKAPGALDDGRPDFLVNDVPDLFDHPDTVHLSDGTLAPVSHVTAGSFNRTPTSANLLVQLTAPLPAGFAYLRLPDPGTNQFRLARVVRSDGVEIPVGDNAWTTDRTFLGNARRPLRENVLHLFDYNSTGSYTLFYAALPEADSIAPASAVATLPSASTAHIPVAWSGQDNAGGRGIATFDVYVSTDGGPFTRWQWETIDRSATFQGAWGKTYAFYSIATDAAGNREEPPFAPDAITTVTRTNHAPVLERIGDRLLREGDVLIVRPVASDEDGDALVFSLVGEAPAGAVIHPYTGLITWVTAEGIGPGTRTFTVQVLDNGAPRLGAIQTFSVTVNDDNLAPILSPIANRIINEGRRLSITNRVIDYDLPMQTLTFRLEPGAPAGASVHPQSGIFTWQPAAIQGGTSNRFSIVVTDSGSPSMSATQSFVVIVRDTQSDFSLGFGTTNVLAGGDGVVPLDLNSGADVGRLDFELETADPHLGALALSPVGSEVAALSFEPGGPGRFQVRVDLNPNRALAGSRTLASLGFSTILSGHSSAADLRLIALDGYRSDGTIIARTTANHGRIFIIENEPLLGTAPMAGTNSVRLTLYGFPGRTYRIESRGSAVGADGWTSEGALQLIGTSQSWEQALENEDARFFRAVEQ